MNHKKLKGFDEWAKKTAAPASEEESLRQIWDATDGYKAEAEADAGLAFQRFQQRLAAEENTARIVPMTMRRRLLRIAAAVVVMLAAGFLMKGFFENEEWDRIVSEENKQTAVSLDDGTAVTMNQLSTLEFPEEFKADKREVKLTGEAFFNVAKNPDKPFVIKTQHLDVQVLGTSFNVRAYPDERTVEVFVKTGKVAVKTAEMETPVELSPNDKFLLDLQTKKIEVRKNDLGNALAWKDRTLKFRDTPMLEVFEEVGKLFRVEIDAENADLLTCSYTSMLSENQIGSVLNIIGKACGAKIKQTEPGRFIVTGKCCK